MCCRCSSALTFCKWGCRTFWILVYVTQNFWVWSSVNVSSALFFWYRLASLRRSWWLSCWFTLHCTKEIKKTLMEKFFCELMFFSKMIFSAIFGKNFVIILPSSKLFNVCFPCLLGLGSFVRMFSNYFCQFCQP